MPAKDEDAPAQAPAASASIPKNILKIWVRVCVVVGLVLFASQLLEISARSALRGYDNSFNYFWLRSAMVDHDWDFRNDIVECNTLIPQYRASALTLPRTEAGRIPNKYGIGWAVVTVPFYLLADAIVGAGRALGLWSLQRDGFNAVYQICVQLGHLAVAGVALVLAVRTIAAWVGDRSAALAGVVLVWAASPLLYYQTIDLSMNHGVSFFAVTVLAYALTRAWAKPDLLWPWLVAGAGWGLAVTTRSQLGTFGLIAGWTWFICVRSKDRRFASNKSAAIAASAFVLGAIPFLALQSWAWHVVYGKWLVFGYGLEGESFHWGSPELWNSLFSAWHGLFRWHPFLLVAALGMFGWAWRQRGIAAVASVIFLAAIYVNAAWWCWWFASSFGNRSYDAALLPLMGGAAWLVSRARGRGRVMLWSLAIAAGCWNFYLVLLYRTGAISRSAPVTWAQMIEAATRLPKALHF